VLRIQFHANVSPFHPYERFHPCKQGCLPKKEQKRNVSAFLICYTVWNIGKESNRKIFLFRLLSFDIFYNIFLTTNLSLKHIYEFILSEQMYCTNLLKICRTKSTWSGRGKRWSKRRCSRGQQPAGRPRLHKSLHSTNLKICFEKKYSVLILYDKFILREKKL
jgi:hypothetical protein